MIYFFLLITSNIFVEKLKKYEDRFYYKCDIDNI